MDLERLKQLEMEYAERSGLTKDLERLKKAMIDEKVVSEQHRDTQPDSFEAYVQMPRQQRRAYQRRLEKEMKRKEVTNHPTKDKN